MSALASIERELLEIGYDAAAMHRAYTFADVLETDADIRTVALAAFTQTPESFRSAAFGVVENAQDSASAIMSSRALGAPIFFSIDGDDVGVWAVGAHEAPRLIERVPSDQLPELFERNRETWRPQALHRAKAAGLTRDAVQIDFVDLGLIPAIEYEVQDKLHQTMAEVLELLLPQVANPEAEKAAFRLTFRLLAAKILIDRGHPAASEWEPDDVAAVLEGIQSYYGLGLLGADVALVPTMSTGEAWERLRSSITLRNISSDSLAFVYENTLVTADTRKLFGTHSTPRPVAEYVLRQLDLSRYDPETVRIAEPFAGAGIFLVAALRELRDLLPSDWSAERRHEFLVSRLAGAELDVFACEVATLSLILADYPNANGWHVNSMDLFAKGALDEFLKEATVVLCNPPFEDFTKDERSEYADAFSISPSKAMVALSSAIDAGPDAIGFVLPRGVLQQKQYRKLRERLASRYEQIELVSLPDRIFEKAAFPCALVIATERRSQDEVVKPVRLSASTVTDAGRTRFLADGEVSSVRRTCRAISNGDLWISELDALWTYLDDAPKLGDVVDIFRGLQWHTQREGVSDEPGPMRERGVYRPTDSLAAFQLKKPVWLSTDPDLNLYPGPLTRPWKNSKVIINNQRSSRGPWRLAAAADDSGLWASQQFTGLWPKDECDTHILAAILNGPLVNAYVTEHSTNQHFTNEMLARLPLPRKLDAVQLRNAVLEYEAVLEKKHQALMVDDNRDKMLNDLLLRVDALVLKGYDLPPRLEDQLLSYFEGHKRPVQHDFQGWLPEDVNGFVPLYEWLTRDDTPNRGAWVLEVFKPVPNEENDAISRFIA